MMCKHVALKKNKDKSIYIYNLSGKEKLWLCPDCHMLLAGKIMQQLATEVFLDTSSLEKYDETLIKEKEDTKCQKKKKKLKKKKAKKQKKQRLEETQ